MIKFNPLRAAAAVSAAMLLSACASSPAQKNEVPAPAASAASAGVAVSEDPQAPIERRVTDRWKLLIAKDAARAYTYLTPGYRTTTTAAQYDDWLRARQVKWTSGKYVDRQCADATTCTVSVEVSIETKLPGIPGIQQSTGVIDEQWLQIEGVWYHLPKNAR